MRISLAGLWLAVACGAAGAGVATAANQATEDHKAVQAAFLEANKLKPGVVELDSGETVKLKLERNGNGGTAFVLLDQSSTAWDSASSKEEYLARYRPRRAEHVFKNHFDAFGEQDIEKMMLDYTEESVLSSWNWETGELTQYKGRGEIEAMFIGFWDSMAKGGWGKMEAPVTQTADEPQRVGFLVWSAPENGVPMATDTFVYDAEYKIITQTFAGRCG